MFPPINTIFVFALIDRGMRRLRVSKVVAAG
jgi:hypothetical protein